MTLFKDLFLQMQKLSYDKLDANNPFDIHVNGIINDYSKIVTLNDLFTKRNDAVL